MRLLVLACLFCNLPLSVAAAQKSQRPSVLPPSAHRLRCTEKNPTPNCFPAPLVISSSEPTYSEEARRAKIEGDCFVSVAVDDKGNLTDIHVIKGLGMGLDEKSVEAVKTWKFEPAYKDGKPIAAKLVVQVSFHL